MRLDNEFVVPRPVDEAWTVLTDVERIAPCMPGAQLTEVVGDSYHGTVKVKVGPVVAQYGGAVRFTELDAERHRVVLEAKGKERNGRGLASALVTADLTGEDGSTRVTVSTDLTISGPLAQFGRGAIAEVSSRLLNQFVDRLKETVLQETAPQETVPAAGTPAAESSSPSAPPSAAAAAAATGTTTAAGGAVPAPRAAAEAGASGDSAPVAGAAESAAGGSTTAEAATSTTAEAGTGGQAAAAGRTPAGGSAEAGARTPAAEPEAAAPADLLRVAAVPILKRVLPPLVLIVAIIVILIVWLG
ncbi:SRPBCC family protein [Rugosimonospora africana]|uniref:Carbon monoxide dehydrogenase subunit G n=1 Tax=Rugosimonospora africana TaxID=556532 RepID=A0A8J3QT90_9ACTN|nr:SRPBCC family protein [Rugosimonospora africana]GIH16398.1 hypothetical protein Raf01_45700 [Rugosimonospora africana]